MDGELKKAAQAVGDVCAATQDADEVGRAAGNLASQVASSGGISESEATLLTLIAAGHAKDGAAKAGLATEDIEAAGARAEAAARHGAALGQASLDKGLPDVEAKASELVALRLQEDQGAGGQPSGDPGQASSQSPSAGAVQKAAAPSAAAPDWFADPLGRHQHRYWDGAAWTDVVADNGWQSTDPLSPASAEPGWFEDPLGRHQHRYWDGSAWTHVVADDGQQSTDPL